MLEQSLGPATVLVNAAGGNDPKVTVTPELPFEKIALEDWARESRAQFNRRSFAAVSGVWGCHGSERPGEYHQHHECFRTFAFVSRRGVLQWQGSGIEYDVFPCSGMGTQRRSGEFNHSRVFSG